VRPGETVLAVSDAGELTGQPGLWRAAALTVTRRSGRALALVPQAGAQTAWPSLPWDPKPNRDRAAEVDRLLDLLAPAQYVQPGLMRILRRLNRRLGLDAEVRAWSHPDVYRADGVGLLLKPEVLARRRAHFAANADAVLQRGVAEALRAWRAAQPKELIHAETIGWLGDAPPPGDLQAAEAWFFGLDAALVRQGDASGWIQHAARGVVRGIPEARYDDSPTGKALRRIFACAHQGIEGISLPAGVTMEAVRTALEAPEMLTHWAVRQVGGALVFRPSADTTWPAGTDEPGSPLAVLPARRSVLHLNGDNRGSHTLGQPVALPKGDTLVLESDCARLTLTRITRPEWATAAGRDCYGLWAEMAVGEVRHRLRWIPPGRFLMGSPESEQGRFGNEGPQHAVTLTEGFWLGETPVTQALWVEVMGDNPSQFKDLTRPVEQVSWDDTRGFFDRLAGKHRFAAHLPTEAQWEYACRAGSAAATWLGDLEILGKSNAPLLDAIAWYGGNSGHKFDLENGVDSSSWPDTQYEHSRAGTRPVATKAANPWGLYDMLGNVWEWCSDWLGSYTDSPTPDPEGPKHGESRVVRGGSWLSEARSARSAYRDGRLPGNRLDILGFRLARGQPAQPAELELSKLAERAEPAGPRRAEPARDGRASPPAVLENDASDPHEPHQEAPKKPGLLSPGLSKLERLS
jgi:formylglycine-generating enzyme required for sulfatase activity